MTSTTRLLRPDIQALRAIAVAAVVINHLWPSFLPGGYVGVDVFFVISGFLITKHLVSELNETGRLSFANFYARRARRLLPAALLVAGIALLGSLILIPHSEWSKIALQFFAASAYFLNWVLALKAVDYWSSLQSATPFQHYWSLSVEEQFYLFWPLFLLVVFLVSRSFKNQRARSVSIATLIVITTLASFAFAVWATATSKNATYFNTFARIWEFEFGALLAIAARKVSRTNTLSGVPRWQENTRGTVQLLAYISLAFVIFMFSSKTAFPGPWAIVPVGLTALIIALGPNTPKWSPAQVLNWRPVQYTGAISYSIYLWHWPLIVLGPWLVLHELTFWDDLVILCLTVVLAALTKKYVEERGQRMKALSGKARRSLLPALASVIMVAVISFSVFSWSKQLDASDATKISAMQEQAAQGDSCLGASALVNATACTVTYGPAVITPGNKADAPWFATAKECSHKVMSGGETDVEECNFAQPQNPAALSGVHNVMLIGDSHAEHWRAPIYQIARANGWHLVYTALGGCSTVEALVSEVAGQPTTPGQHAACQQWREEVQRRVQIDKPDLILLSNFVAEETLDDGSGHDQGQQYSSASDKTFFPWVANGSRVIVIRDVPAAGTDLGPECVSKHMKVERGCSAARAKVLLPDVVADWAQSQQSPSIGVVDLTAQFCDSTSCDGVIGSLPVFYDHNHLSITYGLTLTMPLAAALSQTLR